MTTTTLATGDADLDARFVAYTVVPDALRGDYDTAPADTIRDRIRGRWADEASASVRALAYGIAAEREPQSKSLIADGRDRRIRELALDLQSLAMRARLPERLEEHLARMEYAAQRQEAAAQRAAADVFNELRFRDPITQRVDPLYGDVDTRSIIDGFAPVNGAWNTITTSTLVHHLAAVHFANRLLERDPDLAQAVETEVQRMLTEGGF